MGKKKVTTRRFGRDGKHESLIRVETEQSDQSLSREDIETLFERDLFDDLDHYEKEAREVLEKAGLPTQFHGPYRGEDGSFCATLVDLVEDRKLEPEGWAARIIEGVENTRCYLDKGDAIQAARAAMLLQYMVDHAHFSKYEYATLVGNEQLDCHTKYTDDDKRLWQQLASEIRESAPEISKREIARRIESQTGHDFESIRKNI